jgi:predicted transcriptional regulator
LEGDKNLGSITARKIQKLITDNPDIVNVDIMLVRELPFPEVQIDWDVKDISNLLINYHGVLVKKYDEYVGIITNADFFKVV